MVKLKSVCPAKNQIIPKFSKKRELKNTTLSFLKREEDYMEVDPWFDEQLEYIINMTKILSVMRKVLAKISEIRISANPIYADICNITTQLQVLDVDEDYSLACIWKQYSDIYDHMSQINTQIYQSEIEFQRAIRDSKLLVQAAGELVHKKPKIPTVSIEISDNYEDVKPKNAYNNIIMIKSQLEQFKSIKFNDFYRDLKQYTVSNLNSEQMILKHWKDLLIMVED